MQAHLIADLVTPNDDIEAQKSCIKNEAKEITNMIQDPMFKNAVTPVLIHDKDTDVERGCKRKRNCILLAVALVITGAIAAGVTVPLSKPPEPMLPPETEKPVAHLDAF